MNAGVIVVLFLIAVAIVWAFWLIFKRDLMANNLGKLLTYFAGVILTLLIVLWITSRFLPWWAVRLVRDTQQSPSAQQLQVVSVDLFNQLVNSPGVVMTTEPIIIIPTVTVSPVATPPNSSLYPLLTPGVAERVHTVRPQETLYGIARDSGVTVEELKKRNNIPSDSSLILVGQQLIIPGR